MAQNITLLGASYSDVPAVELPKTGGGTATFTDTSDANATASDIASGKTAYVNGTKIVGTASGGGGGVVITDTTDVHGGTIREITAVVLNNDTVTAASMLDGVTAHDHNGTAITGTIETKTSSDLSASGDTVTVPSGYYASNATKSVASGTEGTPTANKSITGTTATITPSVTNSAGYISGSTKTGTAVTVTATEVDTLGTKSITSNGNNIDVVGYSAVNVSVSGTSKNTQILQQNATRITATAYTKACGDLTVSKTGTYHVYWTSYRTSTSGTWGTQLYIDGSSYGTAQTSFTNSYYQAIHLTNVSLTANEKISVYGRSRGSNYYLYVGQLTIIEA